MDWYNIPMEQVFEKLGCSKDGLTNEALKERLVIFGPNKFHHHKVSIFSKLLLLIRNTRLVALIILAAIGWGTHSPPGVVISGVVMLSLIVSAFPFVSLEWEFQRRVSINMAQFSRKVKVLRDGSWSEDHSSGLVPGDVIIISAGDVVPADARLLDGGCLTIDQQSITGDCMKATKGPGNVVYAGSSCEQGESKAVIVATGPRTYFRKMACLDKTISKVTQLHKVMSAVGNLSMCFVAVAMVVEIFIMYVFQHRGCRPGISNLLVLLIGGIPIIVRATVSVATFWGIDTLSKKGAILRKSAVIKDIADIDVLCCDTRGTLTLNELTVDNNLIQVFAEGVDTKTVVLLAARACKTENLDAIDAAIVGILDHPKEVWIGIQEVSSQHSNLADGQATVTYTDIDGNLKRVSKGAPQQILDQAHNKKDIERRVHAVTEKFAERGWLSVAVAYQEVTDGMKDNSKSNFIGVIPLYETPKQDSAGVLAKMQDHDISVKMVTGDQLKTAKEIGRCLGIGTNMYPVSSLLGMKRDDDLDSASSMDGLIDRADGFADVGPEHKYEIIRCLQDRQHLCAITGRDATDCSALKKADIGIAVANSTDAARLASDIVLTEPGLNVIISAVSTCRKISLRIKEYFIYTVATSIYIVLAFMLLALIWKFDFPPLLMLMIVTINDFISVSYATYKVKLSPKPDRWGLADILKVGAVIGGYMATVTVMFFWLALETDLFKRAFRVTSLGSDYKKLKMAMFLQVSFSSQVLIVATQSRKWSLPESRVFSRFKFEILFFMTIIPLVQMIFTYIAVYAQYLGIPTIEGIGWGWTGVIWLYDIIFHILLVLGMKVFGYLC